jgi:hypothetical protein
MEGRVKDMRSKCGGGGGGEGKHATRVLWLSIVENPVYIREAAASGSDLVACTKLFLRVGCSAHDVNFDWRLWREGWTHVHYAVVFVRADAA